MESRRPRTTTELSSGYWHGFWFVPRLRRLRDYTAMNGLKSTTKGSSNTWVEAENLIGEIYRQRGLYAAIPSRIWTRRATLRHMGRAVASRR